MPIADFSASLEQSRQGNNTVTTCQAVGRKSLIYMVPMEGVEPTHSYEYQILSLARLPIPPHRLW